jgi:predicted metal-binding protein
LKDISDSTPEMERMLEATCPPKGSSLKQPLPARVVEINLEEIKASICKFSKAKQCVVKFYKKKIVAYVLTDVETNDSSISPLPLFSF